MPKVDPQFYLIFANLEMAISSPILQAKNSRLDGLGDFLSRWDLYAKFYPIVRAHLPGCLDNGDTDVTVFGKSQGDVFHIFAVCPRRLSINLTLRRKRIFKIQRPRKLWTVVEKRKF